MCKRMLEGVFGIGKETCLVEKLSGLKSSESHVKFLLRLISNGLEQGEGNILPNNGRRLQKTLLLRRKSVDPSSQHGLYCRWHLCALNRSSKPIIPPLAYQSFCFH